MGQAVLLSGVQIERNIEWLLGNASPPVRYLTHTTLLSAPMGSSEAAVLWREVETCAEAEEIFSKQADDGSWFAGGSWALKPSYTLEGGIDPFTPKYVTTVWILPLLGEMGFTVRDPRIQKACEYVLTHGYFQDPVFQEVLQADTAEIGILADRYDFGCRFSQYLIALRSVGHGDDPRIRLGYEILQRNQRADGGWALEEHFQARNWSRGCPASSYPASRALYLSQDAAHRGALIRALEFLAWHLSTKQPDDLRRFFYHGHSLVHELLMFSELGVGMHTTAVQTIIEWLKEMYCAEEGCFQYKGKAIGEYSRRADEMTSRVAKYRLHHLIETDWLTYYATRIGKDLRRDINIQQA